MLLLACLLASQGRNHAAISFYCHLHRQAVLLVTRVALCPGCQHGSHLQNAAHIQAEQAVNWREASLQH